jgi:dihydroorotase
MTHDLLQQVRLIDPLTQTDQVMDVLIADGSIAALAPRITEYSDQTQVQDCSGWILGPGLVDLYSTVGEPGFESRETLQSISAAAVAGGFTRLALLPSTLPVVDHPEQVAWIQAHCRAVEMPLTVQLWGALTQSLQGTQLVELSDLAAAGICGFSDGQPLKNLMLVRRALEYLQPLAKPIALWPCDLVLAGGGVIREGVQALQTGLPEQSTLAETTALAALLELVSQLETPVHIMRVSTARSVALLQRAKEQGLPVTASVSWLHLLRNSEDLRTYDVNLRLEPPLGNPVDQEALIAGVATGVIDAIAIDHHPYTYEEKTIPFAEAPPGAIGLELALPLLWETFVTTRHWTPLQLWSKLSTQPLQILGTQPSAIAVAQRAELTLFNPAQTWQADSQSLKGLSANSTWMGATLTGRVVKTWHQCSASAK